MSRFYTPLRVAIQCAGGRWAEPMPAIHVDVDTWVALGVRIAGVEACHNMDPFADSQGIFKIGAGAEAAFRVEYVRRDAVRALRLSTVKAKRPLLPLGLAFAEPMNVRVGGLTLELEDVGPDPNLD